MARSFMAPLPEVGRPRLVQIAVRTIGSDSDSDSDTACERKQACESHVGISYPVGGGTVALMPTMSHQCFDGRLHRGYSGPVLIGH